MAEGKRAEYKNSIRSKQLIKKAYYELLTEKEPVKITVTDVIEKAGISRGTFYAHYTDIHDLYNTLEDNAIETIIHLIDAVGITSFVFDPYPALKTVFQMINENREFYAMLLGSTVGTTFINKISDSFADNFTEKLMNTIQCDDRRLIRTYVSFVASGIRGVIYRWLDGTVLLTPDEYAEVVAEMLKGARLHQFKENLNPQNN